MGLTPEEGRILWAAIEKHLPAIAYFAAANVREGRRRFEFRFRLY